MYLTTPIYLEVCDRVTTPASIINSALNVPYVSDVLERVVHVNEVGAQWIKFESYGFQTADGSLCQSNYDTTYSITDIVEAWMTFDSSLEYPVLTFEDPPTSFDLTDNKITITFQVDREEATIITEQIDLYLYDCSTVAGSGLAFDDESTKVCEETQSSCELNYAWDSKEWETGGWAPYFTIGTISSSYQAAICGALTYTLAQELQEVADLSEFIEWSSGEGSNLIINPAQIDPWASATTVMQA